jgi:hypothetical protein
MKGTVFAVALNHQSQRDAWREAFEKAPITPRRKPPSGLSNRATPLSAPANPSRSRKVKRC